MFAAVVAWLWGPQKLAQPLAERMVRLHREVDPGVAVGVLARVKTDRFSGYVKGR